MFKVHEADKLVAFTRSNLFFIFNFHPTQSFVDYAIGTRDKAGTVYKMALSSDNNKFGGFGRIDEQGEYHVKDMACDGSMNSLMVYIPSRCAIVLKRVNA